MNWDGKTIKPWAGRKYDCCAWSLQGRCWGYHAEIECTCQKRVMWLASCYDCEDVVSGSVVSGVVYVGEMGRMLVETLGWGMDVSQNVSMSMTVSRHRRDGGLYR